ncbi:MAG: lipase family protein [Caldilineaceae bacterium]
MDVDVNEIMADARKRARYLARLANYTYHLNSIAHDLEGLHDRLHELGLTFAISAGNPFYDVASGHHGYMAVAQDHLIIAIRGSGEPDDWRNNLRYWQEAYWLGGYVHAGFATAARGLTRTILAELQRTPTLYKNKALWLTGHSSGGTIAIIVAQELAVADVAVAGIYTYGAPKVGDLNYARSYKLREQLHAFVTLGDFVPALPPHWLIREGWHFQVQRYVHVSKPKLVVGKSVSLRAALAHFRNRRAKPLEKILGAAIDFSPHSLAGAYIPNL